MSDRLGFLQVGGSMVPASMKVSKRRCFPIAASAYRENMPVVIILARNQHRRILPTFGGPSPLRNNGEQESNKEQVDFERCLTYVIKQQNGPKAQAYGATRSERFELFANLTVC